MYQHTHTYTLMKGKKKKKTQNYEKIFRLTPHWTLSMEYYFHLCNRLRICSLLQFYFFFSISSKCGISLICNQSVTQNAHKRLWNRILQRLFHHLINKAKHISFIHLASISFELFFRFSYWIHKHNIIC